VSASLFARRPYADPACKSSLGTINICTLMREWNEIRQERLLDCPIHRMMVKDRCFNRQEVAAKKGHHPCTANGHRWATISNLNLVFRVLQSHA
jgi:hypothetical protein